jgi:hypothetical protein
LGRGWREKVRQQTIIGWIERSQVQEKFFVPPFTQQVDTFFLLRCGHPLFGIGQFDF